VLEIAFADDRHFTLPFEFLRSIRLRGGARHGPGERSCKSEEDVEITHMSRWLVCGAIGVFRRARQRSLFLGYCITWGEPDSMWPTNLQRMQEAGASAKLPGRVGSVQVEVGAGG